MSAVSSAGARGEFRAPRLPMAIEIVDPNMLVSGALADMGRTQASRQRRAGFAQAALVIRDLPHPVADVVRRGGALEAIPHIGADATRIVLEVLEHGRSTMVDAAVDDSAHRGDILRRRRFRSRYLSRASAVAALAVRGEDLVCLCDLQMHSTASDGTQSLDDIVQACLSRGYTHAAVTDHSAGLPIANGLSWTRLEAQGRAIAAQNRRNHGRFRLLRGVEANIRADGGIDVPPEQRARIEIVVVAAHGGLQSTASQTDRLVAAVSAPGVHILGHPRGRKYDVRSGLRANWPRVFRAAAAHDVAIEIDGDPARQDLDYGLAAEALAAGCLFALDSDAHRVDEFASMDLARAHAIVAGIPASRVVNCWPLDRLLEWSEARRAGLG